MIERAETPEATRVGKDLRGAVSASCGFSENIAATNLR